MGLWIRIQAGQNGPQKKQNGRNFMFEEHFFGLEAFPEACTSLLRVKEHIYEGFL
jgi:hypothetical protein